ncbi:MAG: DUF4124 domain-containing protein [Burkholderiales bacterium]|nr:DUF4124 domain-containing protein [Burkholderiales bacterium]
MRVLLIAGLLLAATGTQAQVYKCVSPGGQTVYSQSPCPKNARSTTLERNAPRAAPAPQAKSDKGDAAKGEAAKAPAGPKSTADLEQDFRKRQQTKQEETEKLAKEQTQQRDREENCKNARLQVVNLESNPRQMRVNEAGERYFLDDDQLAAAKTQAQRAVESWCK